jgi:hypothetical protein
LADCLNSQDGRLVVTQYGRQIPVLRRLPSPQLALLYAAVGHGARIPISKISGMDSGPEQNTKVITGNYNLEISNNACSA